MKVWTRKFAKVFDRWGFSLKLSNELWYNNIKSATEGEQHFHIFQIGFYSALNDPSRLIIWSFIIPFVSLRIAYRRNK